MFASLMPGIRELRTPLAAGYLWLLFAWLLVEPSVPSSREELTGAAASIVRLTDEGSIVALGAGISFAAYLVGTVYVGVLRAPRAALRWRAERSAFEEPDDAWASGVVPLTSLLPAAIAR
jgi:hypothetical protein